MGKITISMDVFNSSVKLPKGLLMAIFQIINHGRGAPLYGKPKNGIPFINCGKHVNKTIGAIIWYKLSICQWRMHQLERTPSLALSMVLIIFERFKELLLKIWEDQCEIFQ